MKRFTAIALAALMVLTVFASVIPTSAVTVDEVEIRSAVMVDDGTLQVITTDEFAGFYYDFDEDEGNENITLDLDGSGVIASGTSFYTTGAPISVVYESENVNNSDETGEYSTLGFLAEQYIPIASDKLSKLLIDEDKSHTIRAGQTYELADGYALVPQQIDVNGDKVWMELTKDGEIVDDAVIDVSANGVMYEYEQTVSDEDDIVTLLVYVKEVFQGQVDSLMIIDGVWQIEDTAMMVESEDKFGKLEASIIEATTTGITLELSDDLTLSEGNEYSLTEDIKIVVADDDSEVRFYVAKTYTAPGTYEVRGTAMTTNVTTTYEWNASNFAAFFYDLDADVSYENMTLLIGATNDSVGDNDLDYTATIEDADFESANLIVTGSENFSKIAFLAVEYVPLSSTDASKLSKLLIDEDESHTIRAGQTYEIADGYALVPQQIDVNGNKVWMELTKDGEIVDDAVIDVETDGVVYAYDQTVSDEDDIVTLRIFVKEVFQGQVDSLMIIDGVWQIADTAMELEAEDTYGKLEVDSTDNGMIKMSNPDSFTLTEDSTIDIANGIQLKVADDATLTRVYPFIELTITGEPVEEEPVEVPVEEPVDEVPVDEVPVDEVPVDEVPIDEAPVEEPPVEEPPVEELEEEPGFEAIFAIAGLLAVAFLVRRNK